MNGTVGLLVGLAIVGAAMGLAALVVAFLGGKDAQRAKAAEAEASATKRVAQAEADAPRDVAGAVERLRDGGKL